jgi:Fur family ferric uptake transcriptional regulator
MDTSVGQPKNITSTHGLEESMKNRGIRPTAMRLLVLKFLTQRQTAVTLTDIENAFCKSERTTLYRTIKTFVEKSLAHQIDDGSGIPKYAVCEAHCNCELDRDLHLHFHCNQCGQTICLTDHKIPHINLPKGFLAETANLVVKGICDICTG